jgi:hypothetical protein
MHWAGLVTPAVSVETGGRGVEYSGNLSESKGQPRDHPKNGQAFQAKPLTGRFGKLKLLLLVRQTTFANFGLVLPCPGDDWNGTVEGVGKVAG